jgi:hypothetical protein
MTKLEGGEILILMFATKHKSHGEPCLLMIQCRTCISINDLCFSAGLVIQICAGTFSTSFCVELVFQGMTCDLA